MVQGYQTNLTKNGFSKEINERYQRARALVAQAERESERIKKNAISRKKESQEKAKKQRRETVGAEKQILFET